MAIDILAGIAKIKYADNLHAIPSYTLHVYKVHGHGLATKIKYQLVNLSIIML